MQRRITMTGKATLMIGAYFLAPYASTPEHVRDLARCGIDVVVNMRNDRAALDLLYQNGVSAIVSGMVPGWWGGDGSNAGTLSEKNPLSLYRPEDSFADHPAIIGIDAGDEPSSLDFPHYGKIIDALHRHFPGRFAYLNIYPSYALKGDNTPEEIAAQLGADSYQTYIDRYVQFVPTPYICFDYYVYSADAAGLYESLLTVSQACRKSGRDMWTVLQVNSHQPEVFISEAQLRFQAGCALAFGAKSIIWACYCAGWWYHQVLDEQGQKTQQYEKLKKVNAELHRLGETYLKYRYIETHFVGGFTENELKKAKTAPVNALETQYFRNLHAQGGKLLVGQMTPCTGNAGEALLITAADDPCGETISTRPVFFESEKQVQAIGLQGEVPITFHGNNMYSLDLDSCCSVLLIGR